MGANSKIEWCDHTLNFWVGCTKVSAACDFCYAELWAKRSGHPELWTGERRRTKTWGDIPKWNRQAEAAGIRYRVFSNSLSDFFDNQIPERWRDDAWHYISNAQNLDFLILTKRPQNIAKMLPGPKIGATDWGGGWQNVWLGTTVEAPEEYRRIRFLRDVPARVRFLSMEPLLAACDDVPLDGISWVIAGGESGGNARAMHPDWPRSLRDQCAAAGVAFHFKQWGEWAPCAENESDWRISCLLSPPTPIRRVGKKNASRLLDGIEHNAFPETTNGR